MTVARIARIVTAAIIWWFCAPSCCITLAREGDGGPEVDIRSYPGELLRYEPNTWSSVRVQARNQGETDAHPLLAVYFDDHPFLQFGRRVWVPAKAQRLSWLPILTPEAVSSSIKTTDLVLGKTTGSEVLQRSQHEAQLTRTGALIADADPVKTVAMLPTAGQPGTKGVDTTVEQTVLASREASGRTPIYTSLPGVFLPPWPRGLESVDQMIIARDDIRQDSQGMQAIREWTRSGGRLWVMLDQVGEQALAALLGESVCTTVGRVELTAFTVQDLSATTGGAQRTTHWESEVPVTFVRVLTDTGHIHCQIGGWPAAFWVSYGEGEVLVTTLGARGWRSVSDHPSLTTPLPTLVSVAARLYEERIEPRLSKEVTKSILDERVGYRIPRRRTAAWLLGANCAALLLAAVWLGSCRRLERLAVVVPLVTLTTAIVIVAIGTSNQREVPSSVVTLQLAQADTDSPIVRISGDAAIYSQHDVNLTLAAPPCHTTVPLLGKPDAEIRRFVWDDTGQSRWENLSVAPGTVRQWQYEELRPLSSPLTAQARFSDQGLEGRLVSPQGSEFADLIVCAQPGPPLAVTVNPAGEFVCHARDVLSPGEFLRRTLLTDEQRRRQSVYRSVLSPSQEAVFPREPTLLGWSDAYSLEVDLPEGFQVAGSALTAIPLQLHRTPPGADFHVPPTFVRVEPTFGKSGKTSLLDARTGVWQASSQKSEASLRLSLPDSVLPCMLRRAVIRFNVNAPGRIVELSLPTSDGEATLLRELSPTSVLEAVVDRPEALQLDEAGSFRMQLSVSDAAGSTTPWEVRYLRVSVDGKTL